MSKKRKSLYNFRSKDLREETNDLISDWKNDISSLEKKVDSLNVDIDDINQYECGDGLVISRDIIPHGTTTENLCSKFILAKFKH